MLLWTLPSGRSGASWPQFPRWGGCGRGGEGARGLRPFAPHGHCSLSSPAVPAPGLASLAQRGLPGSAGCGSRCSSCCCRGESASGRDCPGRGLAVCRSCSWARLWGSLISLEPAACRSWGPFSGTGGCRLCLPWCKQPCRWGYSAQRGIGCPRAVPLPEHYSPHLAGLCSPQHSPPLRDSGPVANRLTGHQRGPQGCAPAAALAPEHTHGKKTP